jgi:hypothetical protein
VAGGELFQTAQENSSAKILDAFCSSISGPTYLVLNVENQPDLYAEMKKKIVTIKNKPGIFTVNDIRQWKKRNKRIK